MYILSFFSSKAKWQQYLSSNEVKTHEWPITKELSKHIFSQYCQNIVERPLIELLEAYTTHVRQNKKRLIKSYRGPCFGICRALLAYHLECPEANLPEINDKQMFIQKACYFTLLEIMRFHLKRKQSLKRFIQINPNHRQLEQVSNFSTLPATIIKLHVKGQEVIELLQIELFKRDHSAVIVSVGDTLSLGQKMQRRKWRVISPHALFIYQHSKKPFFYFYDSRLHAFIYSRVREKFYQLWFDYIKRRHPLYLQKDVYWLFESVELV